jgi:hypothetical protein
MHDVETAYKRKESVFLLRESNKQQRDFGHARKWLSMV